MTFVVYKSKEHPEFVLISPSTTDPRELDALMRPSNIRLRREGNYLKLRADFICEKCGQSREGGIVGYRVRISNKERFLHETFGSKDPPMIRFFVMASSKLLKEDDL